MKQKNAVGFIDRGVTKEISFLPENAARECNSCKECFPLCRTSYLQAAFVATEALAPEPRVTGSVAQKSSRARCRHDGGRRLVSVFVMECPPG